MKNYIRIISVFGLLLGIGCFFTSCPQEPNPQFICSVPDINMFDTTYTGKNNEQRFETEFILRLKKWNADAISQTAFLDSTATFFNKSTKNFVSQEFYQRYIIIQAGICSAEETYKDTTLTEKQRNDAYEDYRKFLHELVFGKIPPHPYEEVYKGHHSTINNEIAILEESSITLPNGDENSKERYKVIVSSLKKELLNYEKNYQELQQQIKNKTITEDKVIPQLQEQYNKIITSINDVKETYIRNNDPL